VFGRYCGTTWEDGIKEVILKKAQSMTRRADLYGGSWDTAWSEKSRTLTFCLDGDIRVRGSQIRFYTYEQKLSTYGGDDLDFVIMDEHGIKAYFNENIARLVDRDGWILLTETPECGITWEDEEILQRAIDMDPDYGVWIFDSELNPHLSKKGLQALIKTVGKDSELYKAKIKGQMVALQGLVYPMFKEQTHVIQEFEIPTSKRWHRQCIMDAHKKKGCMLLWLAWSPDRSHVYAYREATWKPNKGGIEDLAAFIRAKCAGEKINDWIMDESLGGTPKPGEYDIFGLEGVIDQLNDLGLPFVGTNVNSDKAVEAGIIKVKQFLRVDPVTGDTRLKIFQCCTTLIKQLQIYQYRKEKPADEEVYRELIKKIKDDFPDDLRYGIMAEPSPLMPEPQKMDYDLDTGAPLYPQDPDGGPEFDLEV
jgi:hypothetical protein